MARLAAILATATAAITLAVAAPVLEVLQAAGGAYCEPFKGQGWTESGRGHLEFIDQHNYDIPVIPVDAIITPNKFLFLPGHDNKGTTFHIETCIVNTTSVSLSSSVNGPDCDESDSDNGQCTSIYYDFIRVVNPTTGHCLQPYHFNGTIQNTRRTSYTFAPCDPTPVDDRQFYLVSQDVNTYQDSPNNPYYINGIFMNPSTQNNLERSWTLHKNDSRTVQSYNHDNSGLACIVNQP